MTENPQVNWAIVRLHNFIIRIYGIIKCIEIAWPYINCDTEYDVDIHQFSYSVLLLNILAVFKFTSPICRRTSIRCINNSYGGIYIVSFTTAPLSIQKHSIYIHYDVINWKRFPRYWPFVWGIHRSPVTSPNKGQWRGALIFSLIYG